MKSHHPTVSQNRVGSPKTCFFSKKIQVLGTEHPDFIEGHDAAAANTVELFEVLVPAFVESIGFFHIFGTLAIQRGTLKALRDEINQAENFWACAIF